MTRKKCTGFSFGRVILVIGGVSGTRCISKGEVKKTPAGWRCFTDRQYTAIAKCVSDRPSVQGINW